MKQLVSFLICTYNSPKLISKCLDSILNQKYKKKEIIIVDGGSNPETLKIIEEYKAKFKNIRVFHNKNRLPEGYGNGKWMGWKKCRGEFVFIVDQDNELQGKNCLDEMLKPFKEGVFGCACRLALNPNDNLTNKYISLIGTDPFFAYRSLDGIINLKKIGEDIKDFTIVQLNKNNLLITGGNCFIYKKKYIDKVGGYVQDTENIVRLVERGYDEIAIPKKASTHHYAINGFVDFVRKKIKWARTYKVKNGKFSYLPKNNEETKYFILNLAYSMLILPNLIIAIMQFLKTREKAWFLHSIMPFITGFIYFLFSFMKFGSD